MKAKLIFAMVCVAAVAGLAVRQVYAKPDNDYAKYAKVWSGRTDKAVEFRLETHPDHRYLLLLPAKYDPKKTYPLWVSFHGRSGGAEEGMKEWYYYAIPRDVILLAPHGFSKLKTNQAVIKHWAYWHYERDPEDVVEIIDEVTRRYHIDSRHITLFGTSGGCGLALSVASRIPDRISFIGLYGFTWGDQDFAETRMKAPDLKPYAPRINVFVSHGLADPQSTLKQFQSSVDQLKGMGFSPKAMTWPKLEHDDRDWREETLVYYDETRGAPQKPPAWTFDLTGNWRAKFVTRIPAGGICHDDPGPSPDAKRMVMPDWNDSDWQEVPAPLWRTKWQGDWNGDLWSGETVMRKEVMVPPSMAGHPLRVNLGLLESLDNTYFNGVEVGKTTNDDQYWLWKPRNYEIPGHLVHAGKNVVSVRFFDRCGGGGITYAGPGELRITAP